MENIKKFRGKTSQETFRHDNIKDMVSDKTYRDFENMNPKQPRGNISTLVRIADALELSTDYLLDRSENITIDNSYIAKQTGLSDTAINNLRDIFSRDNAGADFLSTLNEFLSSDALIPFLMAYKRYKHPQFTTPVFSDGIENGKVKMRPIPNDNINYPDSEPQILLAASPDDPDHFTNIPLNKYIELAAEDNIMDVLNMM